jgi:hypothetical protein
MMAHLQAALPYPTFIRIYMRDDPRDDSNAPDR